MLPGGGPQSLGITELAKADTVQQKQIIGEHLYRAIEPLNPSKAGKITGRYAITTETSQFSHLNKLRLVSKKASTLIATYICCKYIIYVYMHIHYYCSCRYVVGDGQF